MRITALQHHSIKHHTTTTHPLHMSTQIILPKLGNSVESSIIASWLKQPGDVIAEGDAICSVETDKTTMEVTSTASGVLLQHLVKVGDDVPVLAPIAVVGAVGETANTDGQTPTHSTPQPLNQSATQPLNRSTNPPPNQPPISPRARKLAQAKEVDLTTLQGSGPQGRIIERDVQAALPPAFSQRETKLTPVAKAMVASGEFVAPERGTGFDGRITKQDLQPISSSPPPLTSSSPQSTAPSSPLSGVRKVIAERMRASLHGTAQLTMNASADARALLAYRQKLKASEESLGLREVTINDLVLFAVAKMLVQFPSLNATLQDGALTQYQTVHLAFAVDAPRGLLVPVIREAQSLSLRQLAEQARHLATNARAGKLSPDQLSGGTFTVSNLGQFGIESFTPILNTPQVAILGVGNVNLKPIEINGDVKFIPHLALSLTIDHQAVDGAPGARFLQALSHNLDQFELLLAM
jgi:pyruvate dehydrogenase E2 component (dihydrolipoamide acetyltransferase)